MEPGSIYFSTTPEIPGKPILRHHGVICADACVSPEGYRDTQVFFKQVEGGRHPMLERTMSRARNEAMGSIISQAQELGANAIVGIDFDYSFLPEVALLLISMSGTAVTIEE